MKALIFAIVTLFYVAGLTACDNGPILRDNYLGKTLIEPELLPQRVPRDRFGNPRSKKEEIIDGFRPRSADKPKVKPEQFQPQG